jgi:hypothetical protein
MKHIYALLFLIGALTITKQSLALDKYGVPHGGELGDNDNRDFNISGDCLIGASIFNSTYGARPDNTGLALFRYACHTDIDILGKSLSLPLDANVFTDKLRHGAGVFAPSELDLIGGITTTQLIFHKGNELEMGIHLEQDRPIDRPGFSQFDSDLRIRYIFSLSKMFPKLKNELVGGDIRGYAALGYDWFNPSNPARPDNTGSELFMYDGKVDFSVWHDHVGIGLHTTFYTDRRLNDIVKPTELDITYEFVVKMQPFEVHLAYERDMPLDTKTLIQDLIYTTFVYNFDYRERFDHDE